MDAINREFYDSIIHFDDDPMARDHYYKVMESPSGRIDPMGGEETVRDRILRAYAVLFCEDKGGMPGYKADTDDVANTADRLYIGSVGYDPGHWYRMKHHFPIIDDDNYDRFAALVIADLNAGPLKDAAVNDGDTLVVGEPDPLHMSAEERQNQTTHTVRINIGGGTN